MASSLRNRLRALERNLERIRFAAMTNATTESTAGRPLPVVIYGPGDDREAIAEQHAGRLILIPDNGRGHRSTAPQAAR